MIFTLIYQGDLPPRGSPAEKWNIRRQLEPQLRKLWTVPPLDAMQKYTDPSYRPNDCYVGRMRGAIEYVPLVRDRLKLRAKIAVQLLSGDLPGGLVNAGDIDNRLKTLLDALAIPTNQAVPQSAIVDPDGRMFVLLEDDVRITELTISTDRLLSVPTSSRHCLAVLRVQPVASEVTWANIAVAI
jgi:hypothetical protein